MFDLNRYTAALRAQLLRRFGDRLRYMGLQGSYLRGEATGQSDIDVMVLLRDMTVRDLEDYRAALEEVGDADRACGFICGAAEMACWNPLESCQLLHTTRDLYGRLADFVPAWTPEDERNYIKLSLGNLFHELCHRYVHGDRVAIAAALPQLCKSAFFILQNMEYQRSGVFAATKSALLERLAGVDRAVLELAMGPGDRPDFDRSFDLLYTWCQKALTEA